MLTSNCMCRPYIDTNNPQGMQLGRFKNRTPARFEYIYCTLFPYVSIPKKRIFLPLFLFCAYDSSVLQNFKIFTHLLPNFSYKDPRLTEVTYHCINRLWQIREIQIECVKIRNDGKLIKRKMDTLERILHLRCMFL